MSAVTSTSEVAVIVGGGPGVSASCARRFSGEDMRVVVTALNPGKPAPGLSPCVGYDNL